MAKSTSIFAKIKSRDKRPSRKPLLKKLADYREVLIFLNTDDETLKNELIVTFPQAKTTFVYPRKDKKTENESHDVTYHKSDFNLTGSIKSDKLKKITSISYDLVVDLTAENKISKILLTSLNQSFMTGRRGNNKSFLYDLLLNDSLSDQQIINEFKSIITLLSQDGNK